MNLNPFHTGTEKKKEGENPNHIRRAYLTNIIFLSTLTILSLMFAVFSYFRMRSQGTGGLRHFYTEGQVRSIEEAAASRERDAVLLQIQSSLESGRSTTQMLREIFYDSIVVVKGGRYYFFPLTEDVRENPFEPGSLLTDGETVTCAEEDPDLEITRGALLTEANGKIDWDRLAESGIAEAMLAAGTVTRRGFTADQQFERNLGEAVERGMPAGICIEIYAPPEGAALTAAGEQILECLRENADRIRQNAPKVQVLFRIRAEQEMPVEESTGKTWTNALQALCRAVEEEEASPVLGADLFAYAAQIDLKKLGEKDRWLIQHEEIAGFPYSFSFWEYSSEGQLEGVPGNSLLYARIRNPVDLEIGLP